MTRHRPRALAQLAEQHGVLPVYIDTGGHRRSVAGAALCAVLRLLGVPIDRPQDAPEVLRADSAPPPIVPPVCVLHPNLEHRLVLNLPDDHREGTTVTALLTREDGRKGRADLSVRTGSGPRGRARRSLHLPFRLPIGYHLLELNADRWHVTTTLFVAPSALAPPSVSKRSWGIFVPTYALRSPGNWGCGDLSALRRVVRWAGHRGASLVGALPMLSSFLDHPYDPSPYRPVSRRFWNEVYADPTVEPEFHHSRRVRTLVHSPSFRKDVARLERRTVIDFRAVARLRRRVFTQMARDLEASPSRRRASFHRFAARATALDRYARFRARAERPSREGEYARSGDQSADGRASSPTHALYHRYVQWVAHRQLRRVVAEGQGLGVELYLDLPIGVHPAGFDVFEDPEAYVPGAEIGSPPDPGAPDGQQWGLPPPHPVRIREQAYRSYRAALRAHLAMGRYLRIDHVMGFHRLFWVPAGFSARDGAYVRYHSEEFYAILLIEASRAHAALIGEDLGTVPPEVRTALRTHGLLRSFVAQLEWDAPGPEGRFRRVPRDSLASMNTHDMLPFAAYWKDRRERTRDATADQEKGPWLAPSASAREAYRNALVALADSPARIVLVNVEDLEGSTVPQNVPGYAGRRRRNFARRMRTEWGDFEKDPPTLETLRRVDSLRRGKEAS